jgi:hypothetical protein
MADQKNNNSEQLQMADILAPDATLIAFTLEMNEQTKEILNKARQIQDQVLKLKEVDEELLRRVVQL